MVFLYIDGKLKYVNCTIALYLYKCTYGHPVDYKLVDSCIILHFNHKMINSGLFICISFAYYVWCFLCLFIWFPVLFDVADCYSFKNVRQPWIISVTMNTLVGFYLLKH